MAASNVIERVVIASVAPPPKEVNATERLSANAFSGTDGEVILNRPDDLEQPLGFEFKINPTTGQMLISSIHPDGLADKAGLRTNDIITHINKEWGCRSQSTSHR